MNNGTDEHAEEDRWLVARERGEPLPPVPEAIAASHGRLWSLMKELPDVPAGARPRPDWQDAVLRAIDRDDATLRSADPEPQVPPIDPAPADPEPQMPIDPAPAASGPQVPPIDAPPADPGPQVRSIDSAPSKKAIGKRRAVIAASLTSVAAGVLLWHGLHRPTVKLSIRSVPGETTLADPEVLRAGKAAIVLGVIDGPGELRVYGADDVELAHCSETGGRCTVEHSGRWTKLRLEVELPLTGSVHVALLSRPLREASGRRADDRDAAEHAGITWKALDRNVY